MASVFMVVVNNLQNFVPRVTIQNRGICKLIQKLSRKFVNELMYDLILKFGS